MLAWVLYFFTAFFVILIVALMCLIKKTSVRIVCIALFLFVCIVIMTLLLLGVRGTGVDLTIPLIILLTLSIVVFCIVLLMSTAKKPPIRIVLVAFLLLIYFIICIFIFSAGSGKKDFNDVLSDFSCERIGFGDISFPRLELPPGLGGTTNTDDGRDEDIDGGTVVTRTPTPQPEPLPFWPTPDESDDDPCAGLDIYEFAFYNTKNELVRLSDYKGTPVCLWLWASWCSHCEEMLDDMSLLNSICHSDGYAVISAVMPGYKGEMDASEWIAWSKNSDYSRLVVLLDEERQLYNDFSCGIPGLIIFGSCGDVIDVVSGHQTFDEVEDLMLHYVNSGY